MPKIDELLAHSGLQLTPSTFDRALASAGLISLGVIIGGSLSVWLASPRNRRRLATALTKGVDQVSTAMTEGLAPIGSGAADGKQAIRAVAR